MSLLPPSADDPTLSHRDLLARAEPRADAPDKLDGRLKYPTDRRVPDLLHGAMLGSPHPHARILSIDTRAACALPGVRAVVTAADIPGETRYGLRVVDRPVLCADKVRCEGDPVAAVAADSPAIAQQALALIAVRWQVLPVVDDPERALAPDAEPVHPDGNLLHSTEHARGDLALAERDCAWVVDEVYETARQMPVCLETEGGIAEPDGLGGLVLRQACQHPERDRQIIAAMLGLPPERVRVIGTPIGGSYGAKDELTMQPILALLAWKTGRAVRLQWSRAQSTALGVKRHPFRIRMRSGCRADGQLMFHQAWLLADTGAYATHGPEVLDAAHEHAVGPYAWSAVRLSGRLAYTNNGIAGAFRGFGAVQSQFALERQIDRLARLAGIEPLAFRLRNLAAPDAPGPLGQVVAPFDGPREVLAAIADHPLRAATRRGAGAADIAGGRWRLGTGLAMIHRSDGFGRGGPNDAIIVLALARDGRIEVRTGFTEMGQGLVSVIPALAARRLGCDPGDVRAVVGDSSLTPDSGPTAASRTTTVIHRALGPPADGFRARMLEAAARVLGEPDATGLALGPGGVVRAGAGAGTRLLGYPDLAGALGEHCPVATLRLPGETTPSDIPGSHHVFGACAALAQVAVDTWTGRIRARHLVMAAALGPVASAQGYLGQMEGGAVIGLGLALMETLDCAGGRYTAANLDGYLIPTLADAPTLEVIAVQRLPAHDTIGPRGAGEIGVNIGAAAIANAVADALDAPVTALPVRAAQVLQWLDALEADGPGTTALPPARA